MKLLVGSKGFQLVYTENHYRSVVDRHDEEVAEAVKDKLARKQSELELINSVQRLDKRFQNFFGYNGVQIAEPSFEAHHNEYRAIMILAGQADSLVFHRAVKKEDYYNTSKQKKIIHNLRCNADEAQKRSLDKILELRSGEDENLI